MCLCQTAIGCTPITNMLLSSRSVRLRLLLLLDTFAPFPGMVLQTGSTTGMSQAVKKKPPFAEPSQVKHHCHHAVHGCTSISSNRSSSPGAAPKSCVPKVLPCSCQALTQQQGQARVGPGHPAPAGPWQRRISCPQRLMNWQLWCEHSCSMRC